MKGRLHGRRWYDSMDGGGRALPGASAESNAGAVAEGLVKSFESAQHLIDFCGWSWTLHLSQDRDLGGVRSISQHRLKDQHDRPDDGQLRARSGEVEAFAHKPELRSAEHHG